MKGSLYLKWERMTSTTFVQDVLSPLVLDMEDDGFTDDDHIYVHYDNASSHNALKRKNFRKKTSD